MPVSTYFRNPMICSVVNRLLRILVDGLYSALRGTAQWGQVCA